MTTPALPKVSERQLQSQVLDVARRSGWHVAHFHDSRRQIPGRGLRGDTDAKGWPDLVLVHPGNGRILFRELKSEDGDLNPAQREWLDDLRAAGMDVAVWRPSDWKSIVATLTHRKATV